MLIHVQVSTQTPVFRNTSMMSFMDSWWNYVVVSLGREIHFVVMHLEFLEYSWPIVSVMASLCMPKNDCKFVG